MNPIVTTARIMQLLSAYRNNILIFIAVLLLGIQDNEAQNFRFFHLTTNNGLSEDIIQSIIQDKEGYMWFGTKDGLNCYDGNTFTIYRNNPFDSTSISNNVIYDLLEDKNGKLWIATLNGLNVLDKSNRTFYSYKNNPKDPNSIVDNYVSKLAQDKDGNIWIGTFDYGINLYDQKKHVFKKFIYNPKDSTSISSNRILAIYCGKNGDIWINASNGLNRYDYASQKFIRYRNDDLDPKVNISYNVSDIFEDSENTLWVGLPEGLYTVDKARHKVNRYIHYTENPAYVSIMDIEEDVQKNIWIASEGGLIRLNKNNRTSTVILHKENDLYSISKNQIWKLYHDREGSLWVGTFTGGVNLLNNDNNSFQSFKNDPDNPVTISNSFVLSFTQDKDNDIWVGTDGGGLNLFNRKDLSFKKFKSDKSKSNSISGNSILSLFVDHQGYLWAGTWGAGLSKYDKKNNRFTQYKANSLQKGALSSPHVWAILEDSKYNLWVGTMGGGLNKFNRKTNSFTHYEYIPNDEHSLTVDNNVWTIYEDRQGSIWVGTSSGLCKFHPETGKFDRYLRDNKNTSTLSQDWVLCIFEDSKNRFWVGTHGGGLNLMNRQKGTFKMISLAEGLPNDVVHGILEDKSGCLWMGTNKGISKYNPEKGSFTNFDITHGLQGNQYSMGAYFKLSDGTFLFGGPSGFDMFNPASVHGNLFIPPIVLTDFLIFNKSIPISPNSILKKHVSLTKSIEISYKQSVFTFRFAALSYINPQKNTYAYMLQGFDKEWNYVGTKNEATYTNLDPGHYTFLVKAANNDGVWNENPTSIEIIISPPLWATWWFRTLLILLILTTASLYYKNRVVKLKKYNIELELRVDKRTSELSMANEELHEKHNWILAQNQEIMAQNQEIYNKNEEINQQKELLEDQKNKIEQAYVELSKYRTQLEELVEERTKELILAKEKAEESDRLKSSFLANLSHEIRTPLNAIIGFSGMLFDPDISLEERSNFNHIIQRSSDTLLSLINDVIDFSKIEAGHLNVNLSEVQLDKITNQVHDIFGYELKKQQAGIAREIDFKVNIPNKILSTILYTDEIRLMQIISNLINNAIKFTQNGTVEFGCKETLTGQWIEFFVKDSGIGIRKEDQSLIFQRFRKVEENKNKIYRGAGLGLAISSELINLLGGQIFVSSEFGKGSVFSITVPVKKVAIDESAFNVAQLKQPYPDFSNIHVLIAEDDITNYMFLEKLFRKTNATVYHAIDGRQAVSMVANNPQLNIVLMDIKMPEMDGSQALKAIRQANNPIPIIAQTAHALSDEVVKLKEEGFTNYITKPIKPTDLFSIMVRILWNKVL